MDTIVAAVIGALATISAALLPMAWPTIANATKRRFSRRPENVAELHRVEVFQVRNSSDAKMTEDVAEGSRVRFFGVSQKNLTIYLESIFSRLEAKERSLEEIDVLFASELDGQLWEGPEFRTLVMSARHAAAELFTSEEWSTSPAKKLAFFQSTHHMSYGGCLIEVPDGRQVAYVANYLPSAAPNAKDSLTFRFEVVSRSPHDHSIGAKYVAGFKHVSAHSRSLGQVVPSAWDRSAGEWAAFATTCRAHQDSMRHALNFSGGRLAGRVLDLACGDGTTSTILFNGLAPASSLTVLDSSPQVLAQAKRTLPSSVSFALMAIPGTANTPIVDLNPPYDGIVIHLAITSLATDEPTLSSLALWCQRMLSQQGIILIAAHNTAVRLHQDTYNTQTDPLRQALLAAFAANPASIRPADTSSRLDPVWIESAFKTNGFELLGKDERAFAMTMSDRLLMWATPAVLDSIIDISKTTREERAENIDRVASKIRDLPTAPMLVGYWLFELR